MSSSRAGIGVARGPRKPEANGEAVCAVFETRDGSVRGFASSGAATTEKSALAARLCLSRQPAVSWRATHRVCRTNKTTAYRAGLFVNQTLYWATAMRSAAASPARSSAVTLL